MKNMPELPEVETIRRIIEPQISGRSITSLEIHNPQIIAFPDADTFSSSLVDCSFTGMSRRGKFLIFHLDNGSRLVLHLRMTGQLLVTPADYQEEKHTHLKAKLSDGKQIRYIDIRRFGRFWLFGKDEADTVTGMNKLGIEPDDAALTVDLLKEKLSKRKKAIKEMLHDQTIIAGIGNIYSDEILHAARIYPEKSCNALTNAEWKRLAEQIPKVITWAIEANEITPEDYLAGKGKEYRNTPFLKAYGHNRKPCEVCRSLFEKITVGGRSSCYCPKCQKKNE
jgi:formamidopyrimidine-DNA glycosylase